MKKGTLYAVVIAVVTVILIAIGTIFPNDTAIAYAGGRKGGALGSVSTPQAAVEDLGADLKLRDVQKAYDSLANKAEFTEPDFERDLMGSTLSLRTYATLDSFDIQPLHETDSDADELLKMHWSSVTGPIDDTRTLHVVKNGSTWQVQWPLKKEPRVPPQVIPVNYLRWDVINRGAGDDWGTNDVEAPHVRIVDMHPINRAEGTVVMGELLNEDVMPAYVAVRATLLSKSGEKLDTEGAFDMISQTLLPKQVTPFIIKFPGIPLSEVANIRMEPLSILVSASADPVVSIEDQQYHAGQGAAVTGQLINQSGHPVNVAHVLTTFYDKNGQVVWVGGQYIDRALQPQTPVDLRVTVPQDLADEISTERTIVASYIQGNGQ